MPKEKLEPVAFIVGLRRALNTAGDEYLRRFTIGDNLSDHTGVCLSLCDTIARYAAIAYHGKRRAASREVKHKIERAAVEVGRVVRRRVM